MRRPPRGGKDMGGRNRETLRARDGGSIVRLSKIRGPGLRRPCGEGVGAVMLEQDYVETSWTGWKPVLRSGR